MTDVLREFLDADGRRTQGELTFTRPYDTRTSGTQFKLAAADRVVASGYGPFDADLHFIAAASKIAPALRAAG